MRIPLLAAAAVAAIAIPATANAQRTPEQRYMDNVRDARQDCRHDLNNARNNRQTNREIRECQENLRDARRDYRRDVRDWNRDRRDWRTYRYYDYNNGPGGTYWADDFYRDGRYYQERRLTRNDRIYRGRNGQYYCRRSDGTTGLIVGGATGALLGNAIANGHNSTLGTLLGAGIGAALGSSIDRGNVRCR